MIEPFKSALAILNELEKAGYTAYFVGGAVRDYLLNRPIHDVDIATSATPYEMKKVFPKTIDIGIEHGTLLILHNQSSYEVTTFRAEKEYVDYRRPKEVVFIRSLLDDLERRDFTINAIAMDKSGMLIDPFNGCQDLKQRKIVTVGLAEERFQEDALRMMRALRFMSQLSFIIENKTLIALSNLAYLLENIAIERKKSEFEKLLVGPNRTEAIQLMLQTNLYQYLPCLKDKKSLIQQVLNFDLNQLNLNEMWALLVYCLSLKDHEIEGFLRNWKLPLHQIREIAKILKFLSLRFQQEWANYDLYLANETIISSTEKLYMTIKMIDDHSSVSRYIEIYRDLPMKRREEMEVTGHDLMKWFGRNGGPWLSETIIQIEKGVLNGLVQNEKSKIKEWLKKCNQI